MQCPIPRTKKLSGNLCGCRLEDRGLGRGELGDGRVGAESSRFWRKDKPGTHISGAEWDLNIEGLGEVEKGAEGINKSNVWDVT